MNYLKQIAAILGLITLLFSCSKNEENSIVNLEAGLIAHYPFDDDANDKSVTQNHAHHEVLNFKDEFTIAIWVKRLTNNPPFSDIAIAKGNLNSGFERQPTFELSILAQQNYLLRASSETTTSPIQLRVNSAPEDVWEHVSIIFFNETLSIYTNGNFTQNTPLENEFLKNNEPLTIGSLIEYPASGGFNVLNWFKGNIDEVRIYNRALNFVEIKELQNL